MAFERQIFAYKRYFLDFYEDLEDNVQRKIEWTLNLIRLTRQVPEKYFKHLEGTKGLYEVRVEVGENDIPKVKLGDSAIVEIDAFNNRKFKGVVYKIANPVTNVASSLSSSTTVTNYQVHIRLLPESYMDLIGHGQAFPFRPNMTASADIQTNTHTNVLAAPLNAVTTRDTMQDKAGDNKGDSKTADKKPDEKANANDKIAAAGSSATSGTSDNEPQEVVFVLQTDGTVKRVVVKTDIQDINYIQILSGLKPGDAVITGPYDVVSKTLKDGDKVTIISKDELAQAFNK